MASLKRKRHYKKDSLYVSDLYTLTFDANESVETLDETVSTCYIFSQWSATFLSNKITEGHVLLQFVDDLYAIVEELELELKRLGKMNTSATLKRFYQIRLLLDNNFIK